MLRQLSGACLVGMGIPPIQVDFRQHQFTGLFRYNCVAEFLVPQHPLAVIPADARWLPSRWITLSAVPHDTIMALYKLAGYGAAFLIVVWGFSFDTKQRVLLTGLIALGCAEASLGLMQYLTGVDHFLWYENSFHPGVATGTYINRNHFAGLLEMTLPLAGGYA